MTRKTSSIDDLTTEKQQQQMCLDLLTIKGYVVWRSNTGAGKYQNKDGSWRTVRYGVKGMPDICGYTPTGQAFFWEVKKVKGRLSVDQKAFLDRARENKCLCGWGTASDLEKFLTPKKVL